MKTLITLILLVLSYTSAHSEILRDTVVYDSFKGYGVEHLVLKTLEETKSPIILLDVDGVKYLEFSDIIDDTITVTYIKMSLIPNKILKRLKKSKILQ